MLPLEELKAQYIPVSKMFEQYGIKTSVVKRLIRERKVKYTEFREDEKKPRRTPHVNPADVLAALEDET